MKKIGFVLALSCMALPGFAVQPGQELFRFGSEGVGPAQMSGVKRVAVDPQGLVYVADDELDRIQGFDRDGVLQTVFYLGQTIKSLAYDRGSLYVVANDKLFRYDPAAWTLLGEIQRPGYYQFLSVVPRPNGGVVALGSGGGTEIVLVDEGKILQTFREPAIRYLGTDPPSLADDGKGFLYVSETYDNHIHKIAIEDGRYISHFGSEGDEAGQFSDDIVGMVIDSQGQIWVSDSEGLNVFAPDGRFLGRYGDVEGEGIAAAGDDLYIANYDHVVRYSMGSSDRVEKGAVVADMSVGDRWKMAVDPDRKLRFPSEGTGLVGVDPRGFVYAAGPGAGPVTRFKMAGPGADDVAMDKPERARTGLAVDRAGVLYVVSDDRLFRYAADGKLLGEVKHPDGAGFFHVAPRPDYGVVATWRNAERDDIVLVGRDGAVETIHRNAVTGAVREPAGDVLVAMDGRRNLYAAVPKLHVVCVFDFDGEYQNRFGSEGEEPGQFSGRITGLVVDGQEKVYVSDGKRVSVFQSEDARFLSRREIKASALAITDQDEVLVATGGEIADLSSIGW
ncbi:MAG TPA: NHL repeat-containing protein [Thermoanaerobaculia bacterium]|nr:NHL repeat-containing protein [Thermoanaerobaculia bacterium]